MLKRPMQWLGRTGRASPAARIRFGRARLYLLVMAVAPFGLEGCQSDPCGSSAGGLLSNCRLFRGGNPFRRDVVVTDACSDPFLGAPMQGVPIITTPTETILPGPPVQLEPISPAAPVEELVPAPVTSLSSPAQKTNYETYRPSGGTTASRLDGSAAALSAPLADLPPITATLASAPADTPPVAAPAESLKPAPTSIELPPRPVSAGPVSLAEGIQRFKVLDPQLAAGSLPTEAGWRFLAEEKGYRTVIDLRPRNEVSAGDDALAHNLGLRYIVLPVTAETLDEAYLRRFEQEIQEQGARPLYVFDADGSRPAILWYLHQVVTENRDELTAKLEIEELGPIDPKYWVAATALLDRLRKIEPAALAPIPTLEQNPPEPVEQPAPTEPAPAAPADQPVTQQVAPPATPPAAQPAFVFTDLERELKVESWQPLAAMAFTGLGMRLVYAGQKAIKNHLPRRQASLPAPVEIARRSLPGVSDE